MHTDARLVPGRVRLLSVQALEDIEYLVKESEVLTGRSSSTTSTGSQSPNPVAMPPGRWSSASATKARS